MEEAWITKFEIIDVVSDYIHDDVDIEVNQIIRRISKIFHVRLADGIYKQPSECSGPEYENVHSNNYYEIRAIPWDNIAEIPLVPEQLKQVIISYWMKHWFCKKT